MKNLDWLHSAARSNLLLRDAIAHWSHRFQAVGIETPEVDATVLAAHILKANRGEVQAKALTNFEFEPEKQSEFNELCLRREQRVPLQHLTGVAHFRHLELAVGPGVFVPRPETEVIAGLAIANLRNLAKEEPIAVDLGTGSGVIALAMATEVPNSKVFAVEKSPEAFAWASRNFAAVNNAHLRLGDLTDAFNELNGSVDVVVTNPPYIPQDMVPIYPEVALHDPDLALYGGVDGLDIVRVAVKTAARLLREGGLLAIEHADIQSQAVTELLLASGWRNVVAHQDFNGRDRVVTANY